ncbi:MAG TPA: hypothetical protein VJM12_09325 [Pyrinomonadaceae bacterium]|nr:hypothetical protein [Pyrinomonadaceae bacterium]
MSQLSTLIWLKWRLFRNSLRSRKEVVNRVASILGLLVALAFAIAIALGLGVAAYVLTSPEFLTEALEKSEAARATTDKLPSPEFILFSIFAFLFLIWATLPLSIGSSRQFDPGRLLIYPISLRKLFAVDFISEITSLQSVFAIPAITALCLGAGLGSGNVGMAALAILPIAAFGLALSKWLSTSLGALLRRRRSRGETLLALLGALVGLGGAVIGQIAPAIFEHAESIEGLRWTPPGAAAFVLTHGLKDSGGGQYALAVLLLTAYVVLLVVVTYWIAQRTALGKGGAKRRTVATLELPSTAYTGWELPGLSPQLAAVVEKELRYVMRNAQVRMMVLMPLILIVIRLVNSDRMSEARGVNTGTSPFLADLFYYGEGLMASGGVLYVFLMLSGISCNQFSLEDSGMRSLILSPIQRRHILIGKNICVTIVALLFSVTLLIVNELVFRDLTLRAILFAAMAFVLFAAVISVIGNWLSIRFPKRMKFGKRLNVSGVVGLLLIPMIIFLALPPLIATAAGYFTRSLPIVYVTLAIFALLASCVYALSIAPQAKALQRREVEILEAVREPEDD